MAWLGNDGSVHTYLRAGVAVVQNMATVDLNKQMRGSGRITYVTQA